MVSGSFVSQRRLGAPTGWSVIYPGPRPERLPVMVCLHGLGGDHTTAVSELGLDRFLPAAVAAGVPPFAIATVDGGTTYWHPRPNGEDAGAMVVDELLPLLRAQGLDTGRLAFQGWSMGGYGTLRLAGMLGRERVRAAAALSAALWTDPADASQSGFADAAEYEQYSVMGRQGDLHGVGCGSTAAPTTRSTRPTGPTSPGSSDRSSARSGRAPTPRRTGPGCCPLSWPSSEMH